MELAARLVHAGVIGREQAQGVLKERDAVRSQIAAPSILDLLVREGLITRTELAVFRDRPLEEIQPFPKYVIHGKLAEGGMSMVYRATYKPLGAQVALKVMKPEISRQERFLLRFRREAGILMRLEHAGIVKGFDLAEQERVWYCAMEFAPGRSLQDVVEKDGPMPEVEALRAALQIARALAYLDGRGIVHRDVKPGNVVVDAAGTARIIDLGLCLLRGGMREDGSAGTTVGTVEYLSPEQARGREDIDIRSDLYAVGITIHQCVTGRLPFLGKNDEETLAKQVLSEFRPGRLAAVASPKAVELVSRLLSKEREGRPPHAAALVAELESGWPALAPPAPAPVSLPAPGPAATAATEEAGASAPSRPRLVSRKDREKQPEPKRKRR